jgi:hypothetical protein
MFACLFREFRNAFFEILHYNNCRCFPSSSGNKIRTSISKSTHSMNTKFTPQGQSRQASVTPYSNQLQRNGYLFYESPLPKITVKPIKSESTDTFEMQIFANQRPTLEAFDELEHLVSNGIPNRATIVEMSSLLYDQDDLTMEIPVVRKSTISSHTNHS